MTHLTWSTSLRAVLEVINDFLERHQVQLSSVAVASNVPCVTTVHLPFSGQKEVCEPNSVIQSSRIVWLRRIALCADPLSPERTADADVSPFYWFSFYLDCVFGVATGRDWTSSPIAFDSVVVAHRLVFCSKPTTRPETDIWQTGKNTRTEKQVTCMAQIRNVMARPIENHLNGPLWRIKSRLAVQRSTH